MLWPEQKVALELDGRDYHSAIQDFDKDRIKDRQLQLYGLKPARITDFEWEYGRQQAIDDLLALLGLAPPKLILPFGEQRPLLAL